MYPAPCSYTVSDASNWFIASLKLIPNSVASVYDNKERLQEAWSLKSRLRLGAALSLYDQELVQEFFVAFPLPSLREFLEEVGLGGADRADEASVNSAMDALCTCTERQMKAFPGTVGEAIGLELRNVSGQNFVMTEEGWQPLEPN